MSRRVEHLDLPPAKIDDIPVPQDPPRLPGENAVVFRGKSSRKEGSLCAELPPDRGLRQGKVPEPVRLRRMDGGGRKLSAAADVVPVDVSQGHGDGTVRQGLHLPPEVPHPQPGVQEQGAVPAQKEVAVGLLSVAVLAEGEGGVVDALHREPGRHSTISPSRASPSVPVIRTGRTQL